ncbi:Clathrin, heavy chain [Olea europaea subsp. europaea]|uniref:Clathrin, heavy chain n=1 Tax=Olea europaea subsp. europaea TaxID=158383 RepID=A0A8S0Q5T4_OLEEU|nr:Clathrin, heavy chain [Olea europaea subsp. europaea]
MEEFAETAVNAGVIPALVELLRGKLTWVEQRVAVQALGHLATYASTFPAVANYGVWGGLVNGNSPAGIGLLQPICSYKIDRGPITSCPGIIEALCNIAQSSDDWQYMAIDCLLWLLQDPNYLS